MLVLVSSTFISDVASHIMPIFFQTTGFLLDSLMYLLSFSAKLLPMSHLFHSFLVFLSFCASLHSPPVLPLPTILFCHPFPFQFFSLSFPPPLFLTFPFLLYLPSGKLQWSRLNLECEWINNFFQFQDYPSVFIELFAFSAPSGL